MDKRQIKAEYKHNLKNMRGSIKADKKRLSSVQKEKKKLEGHLKYYSKKIGVILYRGYLSGKLIRTPDCDAFSEKMHNCCSRIRKITAEVIYLQEKINATNAQAVSLRVSKKTKKPYNYELEFEM